MTEINMMEVLKKLGLTEYESKIAIALLKQGPSKTSEIYKGCYVPKNKIYESLNSLMNKGIVEFLPTIPKRYLIKSINSFNSILNKKLEEINKIKEELLEVKKMKQNSFPATSNEPALIIYGHEPFVSKLKEETSKISKENLIVATKLRNDPVMIRLTKEAIKRGAKVKLLINKSKTTKSGMKEWKTIGVKIRFLKDEPKLAFSTFDNNICRINLDISSSDAPTMWIESKPFIQMLRNQFNELWRSSK